MASIINRFPSEFLQQVTTYLTLQDYYNCLYVCRGWHKTFRRALYKKVCVFSDAQLTELLKSIQTSYNGHLIRELYLVNPNESTTSNDMIATLKPIHLSQQNFELLAETCPELEVLDFDISQWEHITLDPTVIAWKYMKRCAPIQYSIFNSPFFSTFSGFRLTTLHVSHNPEELESLVTKLDVVPNLETLTLQLIYDNIDQIDNPPLSVSKYLQQVHANLRRLKQLTFIRNKTPHQEPPASSHDPNLLSVFLEPSNLRSLTLQGHIDSVKWFGFIHQSYPHLKELTLNHFTSSRFGTKWVWQTALAYMIQSLPSLKSLTLGGKNAPQLFSDKLALELKKPACSIENLYIDFQTYQAIESCQFLLVVGSHGLRQLRHLRLRVWEQIPGWSGVTSNLFRCKQLVSLELSLSKGLIDQFPFTPFLIDQFLIHLPQLEHLTLIGANVQVTYNSFVDLDKENTHFKLEKLELVQSKVENHETVFKYLSFCCPKLHTLTLGKCEKDRKKGSLDTQHSSLLNACNIPMMYSALSRVKLSSHLIYSGTIQSNDHIGIQLITEDGMIENKRIAWCNANKSGGISIYPTYNICEDSEKNTELTDLYAYYQSSTSSLGVIPGNYTPTIGVITIHCKSLLSEIALDNLNMPLKHFKNNATTIITTTTTTTITTITTTTTLA
jgi:hypothetical protein